MWKSFSSLALGAHLHMIAGGRARSDRKGDLESVQVQGAPPGY